MKSPSSSNAVENLPSKNKSSKKLAANDGKTDTSTENRYTSTEEAGNGEFENSLIGVYVNVSSM